METIETFFTGPYYIKSKIEIHFYNNDQKTSCIRYASWANSKYEKFNVLLLLALYTLRNLVITGGISIERRLQLSNELLNANADTLIESPLVRLISYPGYKGTKRFAAELSVNPKTTKFQFNPKGFPVLNVFKDDLPIYAPISSIALACYFLRKYSEDTEFSTKLIKLLNMCGSFGTSTKLTIKNHIELGFCIATNLLFPHSAEAPSKH